jgi:methyl-accepting chemotaxis protein
VVNSANEIKTALNGALAALRGYMLTGQDAQKTLRADAWTQIDKEQASIDALIGLTATAEDQAAWEQAKKVLGELRGVQDRVEEMIGTPEALPATTMLVGEGAPRVQAMLDALTAMLDEEQGLEATAERKATAIAIANARGRLTAAVADLRGFLATGDAKFKAGFLEKWKGAQAAMTELQSKSAYLTSSQAAQFAKVSSLATEFEPISAKIVEIRSGDAWNQPLAILKAEALPRVAQLSELIDGKPQADGTRAGGVSSNQKALMNSDAAALSRLSSNMTWLAWALLIGGIILGVAIAVLTARSIVRPLGMLNGIMRRLADHDLSIEVTGQARPDEIGEMAKTVQVFKDSMLEADRLSAAQKAEQERQLERGRKMEAAVGEFDRVITDVVAVVSSAATELQATAQALSATA